MSNFNNADLFLEPKTTQFGSHMIMSNVNRPKKTKFVNIDTRFRDEYNYLQTANYNITLPERITEVKTMKITNIEIPMSFYNISANLGNNYFKITNGGSSQMVIIPDGNYTAITLSTAINNAISALGSPYLDLIYNYNVFGSTSNIINTNYILNGNFNNVGLNTNQWNAGLSNAIYWSTTSTNVPYFNNGTNGYITNLTPTINQYLYMDTPYNSVSSNFSQTISVLPVGSYKLIWYMTGRNQYYNSGNNTNYGGFANTTITIINNNNSTVLYTQSYPASLTFNNWVLYNITFNIPTTGSYTITFTSSNPNNDSNNSTGTAIGNIMLYNNVNSGIIEETSNSIISKNSSVFNTNSGSYVIEFDVNNSGQPDKYNFKSKLGWLLGFRNLTYTVTTANTVSESFLDLNGSRYLYLAIDEFNKGNQNSFVSPLATSLINKNILGRISMDTIQFGFGTIIPANQYNGLLISDRRNYTGKIDLLKLNVQLLNENGIPMALNGMDFSFCLEIDHE